MITMLACDLLDLPATKVLTKSKIRRNFDEKCFESSESLATSVIIIFVI